MTTIRFYFDFISPYAYLAWTQIHSLAERAGATVEPAPLLFAALLDHHGQLGPAEIEAKRRYTFTDTVRRAAQHEVPFGPPAAHPFNPLLALRTVLAAAPVDRRPLIDALFAATWGPGPKPAGIDSAPVVEAALAAAGLDPALLARAADPEVKARLRDATGEAIARGVFGVPTMEVEGALFWGFESFDLLERHLAGDDPITEAGVAEFLAMPAAAARRR